MIRHRSSGSLRIFAALIAGSILGAALLTACNAPAQPAAVGMAAPLEAIDGGLQESPFPTFVLAGPDATPTPTPFQPLAPTPQAGLAMNPSPAPTEFAPTPFEPVTPAAETGGQPTPGPTELAVQPTEHAVQPTELAGQLTAVAPTGAPLPAATGVPTATLAALTPAPLTTAPATPAPEIAQLPEQINVLLLGADRRPWSRQFRTDTIMLVTINSREGSVNILSFPRDLYVTIPGYGSGRINTAWTFGGYPMLKQTFKHNWGINIDYYALIEFAAFKRVVDGMGGLYVNVAEPVSDYRAGYWVTIPKGGQMMDADTVLWYVRTRKTTNDIQRNRRQQEVLLAIVAKLVSMDALLHGPEFYDIYQKTVNTDIGLLDVLSWIPVGAKVIETANIRQYYLTYNHVYDWITPEGAMVLVPQHDAVMNVIRKSQNLR